MIEAFQNLTNIGWGNVVVTFLFFIVLIIGLLQSLRYIHDFFGIETKQTLKEKKRDEDIKDFKQKIDDLKQEIKELRKNDKQFVDNRVHDREQSFEIQKNLMDNLSSMSNVLSEIKVDILEEKMERKRWNILNLADEIRHNSCYVDRERYENVFRDYDDYEKIIKELNRTNGFVEESIKFIRAKYNQEILGAD